MTTLARIVDGYAVDVVITPPALSTRFNPQWLALQTFITVPDGTVSGAKDMGGGIFVNPVPPPPPPEIDASLPRADFIRYCFIQFGTATRFGAVILSIKASNDPTVGAYYEESAASTVIIKAQAVNLFTVARAANLPTPGTRVTLAEIANVGTNWPKVPL